jgi:hypothetical protein
MTVESLRQMIGCLYVALASAGGEEVLRQANETIRDALEAGAVNDEYARGALRHLLWASEQKP